MSQKGVAHARKYKIPRFPYLNKAERIAEQKREAAKQLQESTAKERAVHAILKQYGIDLLDATSRGKIIFELDYTRKIVEVFEAKSE